MSRRDIGLINIYFHLLYQNQMWFSIGLYGSNIANSLLDFLWHILLGYICFIKIYKKRNVKENNFLMFAYTMKNTKKKSNIIKINYKSMCFKII